MKSKKRELTVKEKAESTIVKLEFSLNKLKGFMFDYYFSKAIQLDNREFSNERRASMYYSRKLRHLGVSNAEELLMLLEPLSLTTFGADDYTSFVHDLTNVMVDIEDEIINYL